MCKVTVSDFYCTCCARKTIPIVRRDGKQREAGHLKKLFCLNCQAERNCVEIRPFGSYTIEDFYWEYDNGNFSEDGSRVVPFTQLNAKIMKENKELVNNG